MLLLRPSIAFMSSGVNSKSRTWNKGRITLTSPLRSWPPPEDCRTFQLDGDKKRGQGSRVCLQLPGEQLGTLCRVLTSPFTTSTFLIQFSDRHTHTGCKASIPYLSTWISFDRRKANKKSTFFANKDTVGQPGQNTCTWPNTRLFSSFSTSSKIWHSIELKQIWKRGSPCENLIKNLIANLFITYE